MSILTKLYCFALFSLLAVASLALSSIYFATSTEHSTRQLYNDGFRGALNSASLELLLERHRRIVESMPSEMDRQRIQAGRSELNEIKGRLESLINDISWNTDDGAQIKFGALISAILPRLQDAAERVAFFAHEFAQDEAVERAEAYTQIAGEVQALLRNYREFRLSEARELIASVNKSFEQLTAWVFISVLMAFILIGPIGLTTIHRALSRLRDVTRTLLKLARDETATQIPSLTDRDEVGELARAAEVFRNNAIQLSAREAELTQLNNRIDVALNNMSHGLCMFDADRRLIVCNRAYSQMYALPRDLTKPGTSLALIDEFRQRIGNATINPDATGTSSYPDNRPTVFSQNLMDGRVVAISLQPMPLGGWVSVHEDITERQRTEARIAHLARHDMLTNLPNRLMLREQLEESFKEQASGEGPEATSFAVYCLDLDNFKTVNDTLGHPVGDLLLKAVSDRLLEVIPSTDFISRIGGDEFALVQMGVQDEDKPRQLATKIVEHISKPYDIDGRHIVIGTSIGIAIAPKDGDNPDQILKNADLALYLAKSQGRGTFRFFEISMDERIQARRSMEIDLRAAVKNGEFELYYQPIVKLNDQQPIGFEALLRWNHPTRGVIAPGEFISLAEETGLILPMGEWVLRTATFQAAKWPNDMRVSVNLSATQFKGRNLVQLVVSALATAGLPARRLELEITESTLIQDEAHTLTVLHQLRNLGVRVALDDFGTGYSSLAYLRNFPFDKIKIDKSFVRDMLERQDCRAIVRAVVSLARSLNITTTVEGVETKQQVEAVVADGCDTAQGYFFARPMPTRDATAYIEKHCAASDAA